MTERKDAILNEMNGILDQLIENAQKLNELSLQVIAEDEITPLQEQQQELLSALVELDNTFHRGGAGLSKKKTSPLRMAIDEKIETFQCLNSSFVEKIMNTHGLIQFKDDKSKKTKK